MNNNKLKAAKLGMPFGTANSRLKKALLYSLVVELGRHCCYQCGEWILTIEEFSVEHIEPWLRSENPVEKFFDLKNVAYSHIRCNVAAANRPNKKYENTQHYRRVNSKLYWERHKEKVMRRRRERKLQLKEAQ